MNRKGFTLIEIIMCVALIAVIGIVVGVNSDKIFGNDKDEKHVATTIISAAEVYAEGNRGIVQPLYEEKGFVILTIKQLKDEGLLDDDLTDEEGNNIADDAKVLVTLNTEGYLDFIYPVSDVSQGYLVATDIKIAKNNSFKCDYLINESTGLKFNDNDGNYLDASGNAIFNMNLVSSVNDVDADGEYHCDASVVNSATPGNYTVKYTYQLYGVRKETTRKVTVLEDFNSTIAEIDNEQYKLYKDSNNDYILYTNQTTYDLKISSNYDSVVQLLYKIDGTATLDPKSLYQITDTNKNYNIKIYAVKKQKTYTDSELLSLTDDKLIEVANYNLKSTKVEAPNITNVTYKDKNDASIAATKWSNGKKIFVTTDIPENVGKTYEYSFDNNNWTTFNNGDLIEKPSQKIYIRVKNQFGLTSNVGTYDYNVDTVPNTPTITSGTSTSYATSRTLSINLTSTTYNTNTKYYYYTSNSTVSASTTGTRFTANTLTLNTSILSNVDKLKYIYLKACNDVGCSNWSSAYNLYISKDKSDYINNNKGCTTVSGKGCFYKGSQSNNYVSYGGKLWRIYQKDANNQMHLILNDKTSTSTYYFSKYTMYGYCSNDSCCNSGAGYKTDGDSNPYLTKDITTALDNFYNSLTTKTKIVSYNYESTYDSANYMYSSYGGLTTAKTSVTYNRKIGLLNYNELNTIATCSSGLTFNRTCGTSYLDISSTSYPWGLATTNGYTSGTTYFGSSSRYKSDQTYYLFKTLGYKSRTLTQMNSDVLVYVNQYTTRIYASEADYDKKNEYYGTKGYLRPVIVLNSNSKITGGNGSSTNPYTIG